MVLFAQVNFILFHVTTTSSWAFTPPYRLQRRCATTSSNVAFSRRTNLIRIKSSKEDEIAALEERLRKLKEEAAAVDSDGDSSRKYIVPNESDQGDNVLSPMQQQEALDEMLSESWKDNEPSDQGGVIRNFIAGAVLVLAAIFFSQIPVGQDGLDKYSTAKPSTTIDLGDLNPVRNNNSYDL